MARPLKLNHRLTFRIAYDLWKKVKEDAKKLKEQPTVILRKIIEDKYKSK